MVTLHTIINNHNYIRHYTSSAIGYRSVSTDEDTLCWSDSTAVLGVQNRWKMR